MEENQNTSAATPKGSMMPVVVGVVLLLLVGGGIFFFASQSKPATTSQTPTGAAMTEQTENLTDQESLENTDSADDGTVKTFTVETSGLAFTVKEMRVKKGDTVKVTFNNTGGFHDWVLDEFNAATKQLAAGQSETIEFVANQAGTFEYYCSVDGHRKMGMVGNLIVEE